MRRSGLLMFYIFAHLTTVMDSSSEFQQLAFAPGVTVEGQFLASLAPPRESVCSCRAKSTKARRTADETAASSTLPGRDQTGTEEMLWQGGIEDSQRFWHVRVRCVTCCSNFSPRVLLLHDSAFTCGVHCLHDSTFTCGLDCLYVPIRSFVLKFIRC